MSEDVRLTEKQIEIIGLVMRGNDDDDFLDMDELMGRLTYECSKQAVQCSIRILEKHGVVERKGRAKRRGQSRVIIAPTLKAFELMRAHHGAGAEKISP